MMSDNGAAATTPSRPSPDNRCLTLGAPTNPADTSSRSSRVDPSQSLGAPKSSANPRMIALLARHCPTAVAPPSDKANRNRWASEVATAVATRLGTDTPDAVKQIRRIVSNCKTFGHTIAKMDAATLAAATSNDFAPKKIPRDLEGWPLPQTPKVFPPEGNGWAGAAAKGRRLTIAIRNMTERRRASFEHYFGGVPGVAVVQADVCDLHANGEVDCFLSSANEFGNMDGGIDRVYAELLKWSYGEPYHAANPLQKLIAERVGTSDGIPSLPIGEALLVRADPVSFIAAPTMRYPGALPKGNRNVYNASRAGFSVWRASEGVQRVVMVPFCVDWGAMPYEVSAAQMWEAFVDAWTL